MKIILLQLSYLSLFRCCLFLLKLTLFFSTLPLFIQPSNFTLKLNPIILTDFIYKRSCIRNFHRVVYPFLQKLNYLSTQSEKIPFQKSDDFSHPSYSRPFLYRFFLCFSYEYYHTSKQMTPSLKFYCKFVSSHLVNFFCSQNNVTAVHMRYRFDEEERKNDSCYRHRSQLTYLPPPYYPKTT